MADYPVVLFSYGTLRQRDVQLSVFGREVIGTPDALPGYRLSMVEITDPHVVAVSGATHHPILQATGRADDVVEGTALRLSEDELAAADEYEVDDYRRVLVPLASGLQGWVYAADLSRPGNPASSNTGSLPGFAASASSAFGAGLAFPLPGTLALRKEAEDSRAAALEARTEAEARRIVEAMNEKIRESRGRPLTGPPAFQRLIDVEDVAREWRSRHPVAQDDRPEPPRETRSFFRRLRRR
ncbi:hypothetical protein GCM10009530_76700 [Microbispora corallina]|uniref:Gamma-glutamylcyclotransferase AIG2-like domain-containing protein n=1 Tax=Microbispora corallina TaxID=83302 RepID=A0ABQ4GC41_9ACTN|nr:gamma-glutamylcyclotransferase family protein [Microbispora corallina]GIH44571.1 hypothetical protein Mco01_75710 [Microbispora corallina]